MRASPWAFRLVLSCFGVGFRVGGWGFNAEA